MSDNPYQQPATASVPNAGASTAAQIVAPLHEKRGWLKLIGILAMIYGALSCITIIGAIWGVPVIFIGLNLFQAAAAYDQGYPSNLQQLQEASHKLATAFFIQGILALIGLIFMALYFVFIILMLIIGLAGAANGV